MSDVLVSLSDEGANEVARVGGKAAMLSRAQGAGLPTLPGVVLTTDIEELVREHARLEDLPAVREAYELLDGDHRLLVVRSSSCAEDTSQSSMAGQFESVIGVDGLEQFGAAIRKVLDSAATVEGPRAPMAVLCQHLLEPTWGGVLFGVDPVTGRSDRLVVTAVDGGPDALVSGKVHGSRVVLDPRGRVVDVDRGDGPILPTRVQRQLLHLAADAADLFGGPQDIEWAAGSDGELWLFQSRPVTTTVRGVPRGPIYGPGPVAETFPEPLKELEVDMWVGPLREAVREALLLAGTVSEQRLGESELVISVRGHVAIDLGLSGDTEVAGGWRKRLDPWDKIRRLRTAWRVGRLRGALPELAEALLDRVDTDLESVPAVRDLTSRQLVALIHRGQVVLRALHAHEILMGLLTDAGETQLTGASVALRVLSEARLDGLSDEEIITRSPIVLALAAPRVAPRPELPESTPTLDGVEDHHEDLSRAGLLREALRLRVRWLQELTGRAAWELGSRIARVGALSDPEQIRDLTLDQIEAFATKRGVTSPELVGAHVHDWGEALPARFQLSDRGLPIPVQPSGDSSGGTGAGGGVGQGVVTHDEDDPPVGAVLVTRTLRPSLAPLLPRLHGLVSETGSVLSHLAILAREAGVPVVVGHPAAPEQLEDGAEVRVDGTTGEVSIITRRDGHDVTGNEGEQEETR